jgi:MFS family permease
MTLEDPASSPFRALGHRDFRLYVIGQTISLIGSRLQSMALSWLVYRLTHSTLLMGTVQFCTLFPALPLGPFGGILADRYSRKKIIIWMQALMLAQAVVLTVLAYTGLITVNQIIVLALMLGVATAFETPARQSIYVHMVGERDLANAIALNSMAYNVARVIGPPVGGVLVAIVGEPACFALDSISYLAVIASFLMMRSVEPERESHGSPLGHFLEGWRYVWNRDTLRALMSLSALTNVASAPLVVLAPVFADAIFHMGATGYGFMNGAFGLGAIAGTFNLARHARVTAMPKIVSIASIGVGGCLLILAGAPIYPLCLLAMLLAGFAVMTQLPGTNMLVQTLIDESYRGRVMGLYSMSVVGMIPLGNLAAGAVAESIGVRWTTFAGGLLCLASAMLFSQSRKSIEQALEERDRPMAAAD